MSFRLPEFTDGVAYELLLRRRNDKAKESARDTPAAAKRGGGYSNFGYVMGEGGGSPLIYFLSATALAAAGVSRAFSFFSNHSSCGAIIRGVYRSGPFDPHPGPFDPHLSRAPRCRPDASKRAQDAPETRPRRAQDASKTPQEAQEAPKSLQDAAKRPQEAAKTPPRGSKTPWDPPRTRPEPQKTINFP